MLAAGPLVTVPGGYPAPVHSPQIALNVRGPADARRAVRTLAARGAAVIKVSLEPGSGWGSGWPMLSTEELRALVGEAHARGLEVTAHAQGRGVRIALDAGVDELAHMPCAQLPSDVVRELARRVAIVATLHVYSGGCLLNARAFVGAGGKLLYGSDFGNPGIPPRIDVEELRLMAYVGLSRVEALRTATSEAGRQLGLAPLGTLAAGAPADIVAVRGDPLRDLGTLEQPLLVVAGGRVVHEIDR